MKESTTVFKCRGNFCTQVVSKARNRAEHQESIAFKRGRINNLSKRLIVKDSRSGLKCLIIQIAEGPTPRSFFSDAQQTVNKANFRIAADKKTIKKVMLL